MTMLDPHLDVDQLSAAVDGVADEATSAHLLACLACREQVEMWRRSLGQLEELATVSDTPAPDDAIAAAMAEWQAPVTPLSSVRTRRRLPRPSAQLIATAAVIVIVLGGITALVRSSGGGASSSASSESSSKAASSPSAGASGSSGASGTSPSAKATSSATSGSSTGRASAGAGPGTHPRRTGLTVPVSTSSLDGKALLSADLRRYAASGSTRPVAASTPCLQEAKAAAVQDAVSVSGGPLRPTFFVPVRYQGVDTRAFVFAHSSGYVAFVLHDGSCRLVTRVDF